ncbi:MAG: MBL fold metallo-hydrolase [Desulfobulbaceae bacterium]
MEKRRGLFVILAICLLAAPLQAEQVYEKDTLSTSASPLEVTFVGHGTLMMEFGGKVIHVDPVSRYGDYGKMPKADIILLTHHHPDHLDPETLTRIRKDDTRIILTEICARNVKGGTVLHNGDRLTVDGIGVEAVPAYNLVHRREDGQLFHPKGEGNGYVLTFGDTRVYIAGDTENTPEMKALENIDYALLPMNLPYTMTPEMVADAARAFRPKVLYPYHFGKTDPARLVELLRDEKDIEIRIRSMR